MTVLRQARSACAIALALFWFVPAAVLLHLVILPAGWIFPSRADAWVESFVFGMARLLRATLRAGGAHFRTIGRIPTAAPCLVVGNHQSLVDPVILITMAEPHVPAFVARSRYEKVPVVGPSMKAVGCPIIDPTRNARGAVAALAEAAGRLEHGLLIFPEGHRTHDGAVRPFRTSGMIAVLTRRRMPVYLVVTDGLWTNRRLIDAALNVHRMNGVTEVLGPFTPPEDAAAVPAFVDGLRDAIVEHLARMRDRDERAA